MNWRTKEPQPFSELEISQYRAYHLPIDCARFLATVDAMQQQIEALRLHIADLEATSCTPDQLRRLFLNAYPGETGMADLFVEALADRDLTPAEVQEHLYACKSNPCNNILSIGGL